MLNFVYPREAVHRWATTIERAVIEWKRGGFADTFFGADAQLDREGFPGFRPALLYWAATSERMRLTRLLTVRATGFDESGTDAAAHPFHATFVAEAERLWRDITSVHGIEGDLDWRAIRGVEGLPGDWLARFNEGTDLARTRPDSVECLQFWLQFSLEIRAAQSCETARAAVVLAELAADHDLSALSASIAAEFGTALNQFFFKTILPGIAFQSSATGQKLGKNGIFAEHDLTKTHAEPLASALTLFDGLLGGPPLEIVTTIRTCSFQTQTREIARQLGKPPDIGQVLCRLCHAFDQATLDAVMPGFLNPTSTLDSAIGRGDPACRFTATFRIGPT